LSSGAYSFASDNLPCASWLAWLAELENPVARSYEARNRISEASFRLFPEVRETYCQGEIRLWKQI
jgi:hypothetical protein